MVFWLRASMVVLERYFMEFPLLLPLGGMRPVLWGVLSFKNRLVGGSYTTDGRQELADDCSLSVTVKHVSGNYVFNINN